MKKVLLLIVFLFVGVFAVMAVQHIIELTQAGLIDWSK
jgi:hypothetical protein